MVGETHEQTVNNALGEVLEKLRRSWKLRTERTGQVLVGGGRPDILIEEASGWPVAVEAKLSSHTGAEDAAIERLGRKVGATGREIETAIALVYPPSLHVLDGAPLRRAIADTNELAYALYTQRADGTPDRIPGSGWLKGNVRDLAALVYRATLPPLRVDDLAQQLETGVRQAATEFTRRHGQGSPLGEQVATLIGQSDDKEGQTRRMAMTVIANALVFHESLAEVEFQVPEGKGLPTRPVRHVELFRPRGAFKPGEVRLEWERILSVNYWPIFWSAKELLRLMPTASANEVLSLLWQTGQELVTGGVTRSHDLTGHVFQRLIADRKFLATYYTRPDAAALLAALALPVSRPLGDADWSDEETLASAQVGDLACGTGTLLSKAYQRLSLLHELNGGNPRKLHGPMMRHGLVGLDVLNIGVHLTAAMLAGSHPDTPFDGECLLTMPYGKQDDGTVAIGSLDLLARNVQRSYLDTAVAVSAGGRAPERVRDLVSRVGHDTFDLIIMNPPFTRSTGMEADKRGKGNPAFAAFNTDKATQGRMQSSLRKLRGGKRLGSGNAGLAADFLDLAFRKIREDGVIALVLPLSAVSGKEWERARKALSSRSHDIVVVTIAGAGSEDSSFSADTGMAECLLIARMGKSQLEPRATFVMLRRRPNSSVEAELLAEEISRISETGRLCAIERRESLTHIALGDQSYGIILDAPLPQSGPWPLAGILDGELAHVAWHLERGSFIQLGQPGLESIELPMVPIEDIGGRGPYHSDISWDQSDGTPRGPFDLIRPPVSPAPAYPILWGHEAQRERRLIVEPDSEGRFRSPAGNLTQDDIEEKAARVWITASRVHYNRDLRFNSQSLAAARTERKCIGGRAWPSVRIYEPEHEYAFALWSNSTLGLLMHWWVSNKTQSGRGTTTVTSIPKIPTFDVRTLTDEQNIAAKAAFEDLKGLRFLPFNQIDEDPARAELDRRFIMDILNLPEEIVAPNGPIDLLRRKLAHEPQIHGAKKSRIVFRDKVDEDGNVTTIEVRESLSGR